VVVGEVPLDLRQEDHVARVESAARHAEALLIVLMKQAREGDLAAKSHRELEVLAHRNAFDLQVDGVGVVVEPNVALPDLVLANCLEQDEPKASRLGNEGKVPSCRGRSMPALRSCGGGNQRQGED
jgi:hypothetical protein